MVTYITGPIARPCRNHAILQRDDMSLACRSERQFYPIAMEIRVPHIGDAP